MCELSYYKVNRFQLDGPLCAETIRVQEEPMMREVLAAEKLSGGCQRNDDEPNYQGRIAADNFQGRLTFHAS